MGRRPLQAGLALGLVTFAVLGSGLASCAKKKDAGPGSPLAHASLVTYAVVQQATVPVEISGTGSIAAWQDAPVGAEVGGLTAVALLVDEGQTVTQGQPLLKMDDVLLQAQVKQALANFNQADKSYQRSEMLFKQGYLSQAGLDTAEAAQQTAQAALDTAQTNLSLATVRAPVAGIITVRKAVLGQIVSPGAELFEIVRDGRIELDMQVTEDNLNLIKPGMAATVITQATGPVTGTVRIVTPQVDPSTRLGMARISVPWSSGLRPGMFATGKIEAGAQSVLTIPQAAVVYNQNSPGALVIDSDNRVHLHRLTLAQTSGLNVVVTTGLQPGDHVVTTGAGFLNDGDTVKAQPAIQSGAGA